MGGVGKSASTNIVRPKRRRLGFTMLEAIVALAIVGMVCVGILGAYGGALRADVIAADRLPLSSLAIERLAVVDLDAAALERLPDSLARGAFERPYATATWAIDTRRVPQHDGLYDVIVRVHDGADVFTLRTRRYRRPQLTASARP